MVNLNDPLLENSSMRASSDASRANVSNNVGLTAEERHLFFKQVVGLNRTIPRDILHYLCCIVFNVLYMIATSWWPSFYYSLRYAKCDVLANAQYCYIEDGQVRILVF
jgi:uncharacterized membrane protein YagU involved in acid resistance